MSDRRWIGIFCICASAYMLYVAKEDPCTAAWFYREFIELTGMNIVLALYVIFGLMGAFFATGLFLLFFRPQRRE